MKRVLPAVALLAAGCAAVPVDQVRVTANGEAVAACRNLGPIPQGRGEIDLDDAIRHLQKQVLARGGNALFMRSYADATNGTAYLCDPPLSPDDRRVRPQTAPK